MYKVIAFWSAPKPSDIQAFEDYYHQVHVPKAQCVPGLKHLVLTRTDVGLEGHPPGFYRVAELYFDSPQQLEIAINSAAWHAMRQDAGGMLERFGVSLTVGLGWAQELGPTA